MPLVGVEIPAGDPAAGAVEGVQIVAGDHVPEAVEVQRCVAGRLDPPAELVAGVLGVVLGVAAAGQVAEDAPAALGGQAGVGPSEAELRLADARCAGQDGERPGAEAAAEQVVQGLQAEHLAGLGHRWDSVAGAGRAYCGPRKADGARAMLDRRPLHNR